MSKIVKITESEIVNLVKKIVNEEKASTRRKTIKEDEDSMDKFNITQVGTPVRRIMVSVMSTEDEDADAVFTLEFNNKGELNIVDFYNHSFEIDDEEVKRYMQSMIDKGAFSMAPNFISFDHKTGEIHNY